MTPTVTLPRRPGGGNDGEARMVRTAGRARLGYRPKTAKQYEQEHARVIKKAGKEFTSDQKIQAFANTVFDADGNIRMEG